MNIQHPLPENEHDAIRERVACSRCHRNIADGSTHGWIRCCNREYKYAKNL